MTEDDNELIDGIDGDALPERLYDIKGDHNCTKCGRNLKGKIAYMTLENKLICKDTSNSATPFEVIICEFFQALKKIIKMHDVKIPKSTLKKIDSAFRDALE